MILYICFSYQTATKIPKNQLANVLHLLDIKLNYIINNTKGSTLSTTNYTTQAGGSYFYLYILSYSQGKTLILFYDLVQINNRRFNIIQRRMKSHKTFKFLMPNTANQNLKNKNQKQLFFQDIIKLLQTSFTSQEKQFFKCITQNHRLKDKNSNPYQRRKHNYQQNKKEDNCSPLDFIHQNIFKMSDSKGDISQMPSFRNSEPNQREISSKNMIKLNASIFDAKSIQKENHNLVGQSKSLNKTCNVFRKKKFVHITSNQMQIQQKKQVKKILKFNKSRKVYKNTFLEDIFDKKTHNLTEFEPTAENNEKQSQDRSDFTDRLFKKYDLDHKYKMLNSCKMNKSTTKQVRRYHSGSKIFYRMF